MQNTNNTVKANLFFENAVNDGNIRKGQILDTHMIRESVECLHETSLEKLSKFAVIRVCECAPDGIAVTASVSTAEDARKLYEWIEEYANIAYIDSIAPGLNEMLDANAGTDIDESVAARFAKYRKIYESDDVIDEENEDGGKDATQESNTDEETPDEENPDGENPDGENTDGENTDGDDNDEEENVELTAIIIEVGKGDEDDAVKEMIDAGVDEDDIEIVEGDENDETVEIKIDVNSYDSLQDYLNGKGIDLEEELGGEIEKNEDDDEDGEDGDDKDEDGDDEDDDFSDDFDNFGDIFGDNEEKDNDTEK